VLPVRLERTLASPSDWCLCRWATRASSLSAVSNRASHPYEGRPDAGPRGMAAGQGLEPRFAASEAAVLPLDDPALSTGGGSRTRTGARFELVASAFGLCLRAPPGTRTLFAGVRVRNIAIHARGT
jgi:hypothetical protein